MGLLDGFSQIECIPCAICFRLISVLQHSLTLAFLHIIIYLIKRFLSCISHCRKNLFHSSCSNFAGCFFARAFGRALAFCKSTNDAPKSLNICLDLQHIFNVNSQNLRLLKNTRPQVFAPNVVLLDKF